MDPISAVAGLAGGALGYFSARKAEKKANKRVRKAKNEMKRQKEAFSAIDTSNPYLNMENTMEDLTVNTQAADMQAQQFQQSQANILDNMRGAAGGSGVAGVAQALAQQGQLAAQQSSASIGAQEAANQMAAAQEAGRLQSMERQGELISRQQQRDKTGTLLGMAQSELAANREQQAQAKQAKMDAVQQGISGVVSAFSDRRLKKNIEYVGDSPSGLKIYNFEYDHEEARLLEGNVYQGVMSDEVPSEAIVTNNSGYDMVDYSKIDVEFKCIK
jgi:hypothetical protein